MTNLEKISAEYRSHGIDKQIDYDKFYLYSIITHSTAIEGSTITEIENQIMFEQGVTIKGKTIEEQMMNLDLKEAYELSMSSAQNHVMITPDFLCRLSAAVMKNTGKTYHTALGEFSSSNGDLRLLNVTAGIGGKSYMNYNKVPERLQLFCNELNNLRNEASSLTVQELYDLSFDAHLILVTIHPWADGNGRMARLLMNHLQFEFGLIPCVILKEDKEDYIKVLVESREKDDMSIFRKFMSNMMIKNLRNEIDSFKSSMKEDLLSSDSWDFKKNKGLKK